MFHDYLFSTLRSRQNRYHFTENIFKCIFLDESVCTSIKISLRVQWTIWPQWFRKGEKATSHYLNQWWLVYWRIHVPLGLNELIVIRLTEGKRRLWNALRSFVRSFVYPPVRSSGPNFADAETKFIEAALACRYASLGSFAHGGIMGVPMGMMRAPGILRMLEISNHWGGSFRIKLNWTALGYRYATSCLFDHGAIIGMPVGVIGASGILQMPELSTHWADSLQIKFIGTVLPRRCATS